MPSSSAAATSCCAARTGHPRARCSRLGLRRRGAQQADHRRGQHVDRDRPVQPPPPRPRRGGQGRRPRGRRHAHGVQHRLDQRRHHHGHRRHAGLAHQPRGDRRLDRARRRAATTSTASIALCGCDKTIPGTTMAVARLGIPGLVLYGGLDRARAVQGPRRHHPGRVRGGGRARLRPHDRRGPARRSRITRAPGPGACGGQFTANTMATAIEFLGMAPMGSGIGAGDCAEQGRRRAGGPARS